MRSAVLFGFCCGCMRCNGRYCVVAVRCSSYGCSTWLCATAPPTSSKCLECTELLLLPCALRSLPSALVRLSYISACAPADVPTWTAAAGATHRTSSRRTTTTSEPCARPPAMRPRASDRRIVQNGAPAAPRRWWPCRRPSTCSHRPHESIGQQGGRERGARGERKRTAPGWEDAFGSTDRLGTDSGVKVTPLKYHKL